MEYAMPNLTVKDLKIVTPFTEIALEGWGERRRGKVRDIYQRGDQRILITTDRVSAFDRVLTALPYKGQVLNQLSEWWFQQTQHIVANHMLAVPDPNVMIVREVQALPIEVIVRGYITGVTKTSLWTLYEAGQRSPYGVQLPDGLRKNDKLPTPVLTPTTKAEGGLHDTPLTPREILEHGLLSPSVWSEVERIALALFAHGQSVAERAGLLLVDTKYEFGIYNNQLILIDEIHTPDSSRYWHQESYHQSNGLSPIHYDKEYLRQWYISQEYRGEGDIPQMPNELRAEIALRYIWAYEQLTESAFIPAEQPTDKRIQDAMAQYRSNP
jgi:phosphoribosylaminoimidazole-succinocarboxamide synthase